MVYLEKHDDFDRDDPSTWTRPMRKNWRQQLQYDSVNSQVGAM